MVQPLTTLYDPVIERQRALLWNARQARIAFNLLAYGLTTIYLPIWVAALAAVMNTVLELLTMIGMQGLQKHLHIWRYRAVQAGTFAMELVYAACAALIWQQDANHAKAFAVGMIMATLLHLATERAIYLPFGLAGLAGVAVAVFAGNAAHWVPLTDWDALALSTLCAVGGIGYALAAMIATSRLHRDTLQGQAAAQAGNEAKSRFLAQMSHELRTPLNAILGMGHAELRRATDPESRNRLAVLTTSAEGLSHILDDILDLSAVQAGAMPIRPRAAVPSDVLTLVEGLFRPSFEEAGQTFHCTVGPGLDRPALFDDQRLRQCLTNLLSNALRHSSGGTVSLTAERWARADAAPILRIEVRDSGPGVPEARKDAIFEPFSNGFATTADRANDARRSNGLGLSISRAMARNMGGDLWLAASKDSGARFVLVIALPNLPETANPAPPRPAAVCGLAGMRVLVVDDVATNRLVASTYLRELGLVITECHSGEAALDLVTRSRFDLILMDINMPGMSGLETLRRLRDRADRTPVIAMTADATPQSHDDFLAQGMAGCLTKPILPDQMERCLCEVLDKHATGMTPPAGQAQTTERGHGWMT